MKRIATIAALVLSISGCDLAKAAMSAIADSPAEVEVKEAVLAHLPIPKSAVFGSIFVGPIPHHFYVTLEARNIYGTQVPLALCVGTQLGNRELRGPNAMVFDCEPQMGNFWVSNPEAPH